FLSEPLTCCSVLLTVLSFEVTCTVRNTERHGCGAPPGPPCPSDLSKGADAYRPPHPPPRLHRRAGQPPALRLLRGTPRPLRLHRHLRAGPPHRRRGRAAPGRARPGARTRCHRHPLPRRQLRLRLPLGGLGRPRGGPPPAAGPRLALHR